MRYEALRPVRATTDAHPIQINPDWETLLPPPFSRLLKPNPHPRVQIKSRFLALRRAIRSG